MAVEDYQTEHFDFDYRYAVLEDTSEFKKRTAS